MDGQAAADVAADLSRPHVLASIAQRAQPKSQVIALMNVVPRLLQRQVLRTTIQVEWADGGVAIALPGQRRSNHLVDRANPGCLGRTPAAPNQGGKSVLNPTDNDQIQWIAVAVTVLVGYATGQSLEGSPQNLRLIELLHLMVGVDRRGESLASLVVGQETRHFGQK